jgi:hypothetical protein
MAEKKNISKAEMVDDLCKVADLCVILSHPIFPPRGNRIQSGKSQSRQFGAIRK